MNMLVQDEFYRNIRENKFLQVFSHFSITFSEICCQGMFANVWVLLTMTTERMFVFITNRKKEQLCIWAVMKRESFRFSKLYKVRKPILGLVAVFVISASRQA